MRKYLFAAVMLCSCLHVGAQELFVYTEPASNMPAHSIGLRASNLLMHDQVDGGTNYHLIPEVMWGVNKNLMLHTEGFFSNRNGGLAAEGAGFYAKYRFLSHDEVYRHFRMAGFVRVARNASDVHQEEIVINGHNSGAEGGLIATQLLHRQAVSATVSYAFAADNVGGNELPVRQATQGVNYALSTGRLLLPKSYKSYGQLNVNVMLEVLGQWLPEVGRSYLDIGPSVQGIINSQLRVDVGYRRQVYSTMLRSAPNGVLVRVEYLFFNVLR